MLLPVSSLGQVAEELPDEPSTETPEHEGQLDLDRVERLILKQVNTFRQQHQREPVKLNMDLDDAVEYFAKYMARTGNYGHQADGKQPSERAREHDYEYCIVLENIAWAYRSDGFTAEQLAEQFVSGWENSPGHRKNMLEPDVLHTGIAVAQSPQSGKYYAVQMFGRPRSAMIRYKISNRSSTVVEYRVGGETFKIRPRYTRTHGACRPSALRLPIAKGSESATQAADKGSTTLRPEDSAHYVIRAGKDGTLTLIEQ